MPHEFKTQVFKHKSVALQALPGDARLTSSFGYPGHGGYVAFYRQPDGTRYTISNGDYNAFEPFEWIVKRVGPGAGLV